MDVHGDQLGTGESANRAVASGSDRTDGARGATFHDVANGLIEREAIYTDLSTLFVELGVSP